MAKSHQPAQTPQTEEASSGSSGSSTAQQVMPPGFSPRAQAQKLYSAMSGMGTDERAIFDALHTGRSDLNRAIEAAFNQMYPRYSLRYWLKDELGGSDYTRAIQLLGRGDFTLAQKLAQAASGWGTDEQKIFHALEVASASELEEVKSNASLMARLREELNDDDFQLASAFLNGHGALVAKLRRAVNGWGSDEAAIWRAIDQAPQADRDFVLSKRSLMGHLSSDLSASDYLRAVRMLDGTWDNVDKIEVALKGVGTDEAGLIAAISRLSGSEYAKLNRGTTELPNGVSSLKNWMVSDLSGDLEFEALEILHQIQLAHDPEYAVSYRESQLQRLGEAAMQSEGASALVASDGQAMSSVGRLRKACVGAGTDEEAIWDVAASIPAVEGRWILAHNPDHILGVLRSDLSGSEYFRLRQALGGGALGRIAVLRNAVSGMGTTESQIYEAIDAILIEGVGAEVLTETSILRAIQRDVDPQMYRVFLGALRTGTFTPIMRLVWATAGNGTNEALLFSLCGDHGEAWRDGEGIRSDVERILSSELSTRDFWKAKDLIRGEPSSEQGRLDRAKEMLERQRGVGYSAAIVDAVSDSGTNADEAWREYQATYNRAHEDGDLSEHEQGQLRQAEEYSQYTTSEYASAKASFAQWASQIAITIVGIVATVLTAGAAAGPFIAALSANAGTIATTMVAAAALKVGIHKAIEGEGYDLESMDTLVDGVGAAIEGGLFIIGNLGAARIVHGMSKTQYAASIGGSVEQTFGSAGRRILAGGFEGAIDGTIGGMGEGVFRGLANDETWAGSLGEAFTKASTTALLHGAIGGGSGFAGGALFKSLGETFGPSVRRMLGSGKAGANNADAAMNTGAVDDIMAKMPDDLEGSVIDQRRLTEAAFETNQRMQVVSDNISSDYGLQPSKVGLKGNKFGTNSIDDIDQESFINKVLEKSRRWEEPTDVGSMTDMSRGRFEVDNFEDATAIADGLESRLNQAFGPENVMRKPITEGAVYRRHHILVRDPATGISHEWQIGTKSLTKMIEGIDIILPPGVTLHGQDFHVVMYDVLDKLSDPNIRAKHGLPDSIIDEIGLTNIRSRYNALMIEAGSVKKGSLQPDNFDVRLRDMAQELGEAVDKLEKQYPGLATKLDTKLVVDDVPASASARARSQPEMPAAIDGDAKAPRVQDDPQPKMADKHEGVAEYRPYKNAVAYMADGKIDPLAAKQGALGDCYLIAGAAAEARANPEGLRKLIKDNGDGTFDVTLYLRENWFSPPRAKVITVDAQFPTMSGRPVYAPVGRSAGDEDAMWMALFEKALAKETGSYGHISGGQINKNIAFGGVHELMTGNKVRYVTTASLDEDALLRRMADALDNQEPLAAGTYNMKDDPGMALAGEKLNIYGNHAYAIESVDIDARTVNLQNPWGSAHPRDISISDFKTYYKRLDIGVSAKASNVGGASPQFDVSASTVDRVLDGLNVVGDNVGLTIVRANQMLTAMASTRARGSASDELLGADIQPGEVEFPSQDIREMYWAFLTSPSLVKFEGLFGGTDAIFFVDVQSGTMMVTDIDGLYLTGLSLMDDALADLLMTGEM